MKGVAIITGIIIALTSCGEQEKVAPAKRVFNGETYIVVPAGTYSLGKAGDYYNPPHEVKLGAFAICEHEVTNREFAAFVTATGYVTDAERLGYGKTFHEGLPDWQWTSERGAYWRMPFGPDGDSAKPAYPVTQISRADADAYCLWAGVRLPSVDEWEAAARAGAETDFPWGDSLRLNGKAMANVWESRSHIHYTGTDGYVYTAPVKSYPPNAWGLYDVVGNVFEYCDGNARGIPTDTAKRYTAGRGGSWWCSANACDAFNLHRIGSMIRHGSLANQGFRVVLK